MTKTTLYQKLPDTPGVYLMKNTNGKILYIGKAGNLKRRVSSYFQKSHDYRIEKLISQVKKIDFKKADTALEALILESELIKKHQPLYNVLEKDDRSFIYFAITSAKGGEKFPRLVLTRGKDIAGEKGKYSQIYGPFLSARDVRESLKLIRQIFPWNTHSEEELKKRTIRNLRHLHRLADSHHVGVSRPCFDFQIGNCPGVCVDAISETEYKKIIHNLKLFLAGKKSRVIRNLEAEMKQLSEKLEFEKAEKIRRQIFGLKHINDIALIKENNSLNPSGYWLNPKQRIEGYDISQISGTAAVGGMVVFSSKGGSAFGGNTFRPDKNEYRKFKIRAVQGQDDTAMIKEILTRRFKNNWPHPDLILIDGGRGQVNAAKSVLNKLNLFMPVIGLAKGPERKKNELIGKMPAGIEPKTLIQIRDEAHRFAIAYHRRLRGKIL